MIIKESALVNEHFRRILPNFLHFLYDTEEFLPETVILDWYSKLPTDSPLRRLEKLGELIEWLERDDEDDDDEDEDED